MKQFFTGQPCQAGHVGARLVSAGQCHQCHLEKNRQWRIDNHEHHLARMAAYNAANRDRINRLTRENHKAKRAENQARVIQRRAAKRGAKPVWYGELDRFVMSEADNLARRREAATGIKWQVDHMIPLQARTACGLHCAWNLQVIPATMNASKLNRMMWSEPGAWIRDLP